MAKITEEELKELESTLPTKPYVLSYRGDNYVFKTMNKVDCKNFRKLTENKDPKKSEENDDKLEQLVLSQCIWPDKEIVDIISEADGLFVTSLAEMYGRAIRDEITIKQ